MDIPYVDKTVQNLVGDSTIPGQRDFAKIEGASVGPALLWPNGRVPYSFAAFLSMYKRCARQQLLETCMTRLHIYILLNSCACARVHVYVLLTCMQA